MVGAPGADGFSSSLLAVVLVVCEREWALLEAKDLPLAPKPVKDRAVMASTSPAPMVSLRTFRPSRSDAPKRR